MQTHQVGSTLWREWDGEGFDLEYQDSIVLYTLGHMSIGVDAVRSSLSVFLTQIGAVDSRGEANHALLFARELMGFAGPVNGEDELTVCTRQGETYYGDSVDQVHAVTWVEIDLAR